MHFQWKPCRCLSEVFTCNYRNYSCLHNKQHFLLLAFLLFLFSFKKRTPSIQGNKLYHLFVVERYVFSPYTLQFDDNTCSPQMLNNDRWVCTKKWQVEARVLLVQTTADTEGTAGKTPVGVFITVMLLTVCVLIKYRSTCIITKSCFALPLWLFDIFLWFPARWTGLTVGRVWAVWQSSVTHTAALGTSSYIMLTCDDRQGFWRKSLTTEISENHTLLFDLRFPTPNTLISR